MREQLIRYLLGELDEEERREVRALLRDNPELQKELAHLKECFASNEDDEAGPLPPRSLAKRTADTISNSDEFELEQMVRSKSMTAISEPPTGILGWSLADLTVAGGVMLAVSMLVFPALRESREGTRRTVCEHNQYQLGMALAQFAADNNNYFPHIDPKEYAGMFVVRLLAKGYAQPGELEEWLLCPAAPVANDVRAGRRVFKIPGPEQLKEMPRIELANLAATINPCYAVPLPYRDEMGEYHDILNQHSQYLPVFSDASDTVAQRIGPNHGGLFIQILFQDGHVKAFTSSMLPSCGDNMFRNRNGVVAVGTAADDSVLASCYVVPDPTAEDPVEEDLEYSPGF